MEFGLFLSPETAMEQLEKRVKADPFFRHRWRGGTFAPTPLHLRIHLDEQGRRDA